MQRMRFERFGLHDGIPVPRTDDAIGSALEPQYFQSPRPWIHEPHVVNTLARIDRKFSRAIERRRRGGEHFADPSRRELGGASSGGTGHDLTTLAGVATRRSH